MGSTLRLKKPGAKEEALLKGENDPLHNRPLTATTCPYPLPQLVTLALSHFPEAQRFAGDSRAGELQHATQGVQSTENKPHVLPAQLVGKGAQQRPEYHGAHKARHVERRDLLLVTLVGVEAAV